MELKRVVVTGMGAVTPLGNNPKETWENMLAGKSGAAPITLFDASKFKTQFACEVKNLDINAYIDRKEARKMDRYTQLAIIAAQQAVEDCGMDLEAEDKNRIGVVYGVGIGGIKTFEEEVSYYGAHREDGPKFNPFFIPKMIADIAAGQISIMYGFHGPNYITASACASSSNALADAFNLIRLGKANAIVAGGAEAAICETGVGGFNAMKALSTRNDEPEKASRPFSASRDGFIMGEGAGCLILEELEHAKARGAKIYAEMVGAGMSADAHHITASACASSSNALADAFNLIRLGKANMILAGGAEAAICATGVGGFNAMKALSTRNDEPEKASRPFSASRDGFIMAEGAGCLILEELEHAKARGAKIYAEMVGAGMSADAHHITASHPEGLGAKLVMKNALEDAGMKPEDIDYINVHGTSTHVGDISEAKAIKEVFGDAAFKLNISSTKSMTGHLLGAAGAVEAMATILAIKNDIVPPTINHEDGDEDPEIDYNLNFTFNKAQKREVRAGLSNTFGFGGHNACVVFKKYVD